MTRVLRAGTLTVFLTREGDQPGPRTNVVSLEAPALVSLGAAPRGWRWEIGKGLVCDSVELDGADPANPPSFRTAAVRTIEAIGDALRPLEAPPADRLRWLESEPMPLAADVTAIVDRSVWATAVAGTASVAGHVLPAGGAPLPPRLPLSFAGSDDARVVATPIDEVEASQLVMGVSWLFDQAAEAALDGLRQRELLDKQRIIEAPAKDTATEEQALKLLAAELAAQPPLTTQLTLGADPLVTCASMVGSHAGLVVTAPSGGLRGREGTAAVRAIALASRLYMRRVSLLGQWWMRATTPVLGFRPDGAPIALLPAGETMIAVDADGEQREVDEAVARSFLDTGFVFSAPLEDDHVSFRSVLWLAVGRRHRLVLVFVAWALVIAVLGLVVPRASGVVFDRIIPQADRSRLLALIGILIAVSLATVPVHLMFSIARTRLEAPASFDVQRGLFGRMLRSSASAVQAFGVGDVTTRLHSLETLRDPIDQSIISPVSTLLSGLVAGAVLIYYDAALAAIVLSVGVVCLGVAVALAAVVARRQRAVDEATGAVNSFLMQVLLAIPKLRVAGGEARAFSAWADKFRHAVGRRLIRASADQMLFTAMIQTIGMLALFAGATALGTTAISVGVFMAFQTTYGLFLGGVTAATRAVGTAMLVRPALGRAVELASAPVESAAHRADPGPLRGAIALANVTFRYQPNMKPVLNGLSLRVEAGEMVAIAGRSGCGKSTMMRILLGFEQPEDGSVLYDDQDLTSLDVEAIRRQLGVVLQDGQLAPGTIRENLSGVATMNDAELWELATLVALDDDIRAMPMGLDTVITLNGGAFSGGQRQRLLIARALANRPRVLLLDEATSALDNVTQRVITNNLADLGMTRIVIAHRLSTMVDADRILVFDGGRVAEQGAYRELMSARGLFHSLASRQLLEEST